MEGFYVQRRKKCPMGYKGRMYLVACCECDKQWLAPFVTQLQTVLYNDSDGASDLELEVWRKKACIYLFISFPMGDEGLVSFIMTGFHLICLPWKGNPTNSYRLKWLEPGRNYVSPENMFETMITAYAKHDYIKVAKVIDMYSLRENGFYMFMCLLNAHALNQSPLTTNKTKVRDDVMQNGADKYVAFHREHNGIDSLQYGYALLMRVFCTKGGENDLADLDTAKALVPSTELLVPYLYGIHHYRQGQYQEAADFFIQTDPSVFAVIAERFGQVSMWHYAYGFAHESHKHFPSEASATLLARCAYALGKRSLATKILGREKRALLKQWSMSGYRLCEHCQAVLEGEMIMCAGCNEAFYCNDQCAEAGSAKHRKSACRCCRFCGAHLPKGGTRFRCSGCYLASYCGADCQRRDWEERDHKSVCQ